MDRAKKEQSPAKLRSPEGMFINQTENGIGIVISTPNLPIWPSVGDSGGNQQDSGYCSFTPSSSSSFDIFSNKLCLHCNKNTNYEKTNSEGMICYCHNKGFYGCQSPYDSEYLESISETSSHNFCPLRFRTNKPLDLHDGAMDTSLYGEDMDVEDNSEEHHCIGPMEIGEEQSVDFVDSGICLSSSRIEDSNRLDQTEEKTEAPNSIIDVRNIFSHQKTLTTCKDFSPKIMNETTPSKIKKVHFQTTVRKITTINRFLRTLNGIDKIDILYQLSNDHMNLPCVVSKIFSFLSEKDLDRVRLVSKHWNELLSQSYTAHNRWKSYHNAMKMMKENLMSPTKKRAVIRPVLFDSINNISNITNIKPQHTSSSPRVSPPVSPDSARFRSFQKAAKFLKKGERLLQCPRCHFASCDRGSPTVQCPRSGCRHHFCVWCKGEIITGSSHNCPPLYTPQSRRSSYKIGSKISKRNLRRL